MMDLGQLVGVASNNTDIGFLDRTVISDIFRDFLDSYDEYVGCFALH